MKRVTPRGMVVIGAGHAGGRAAHALRSNGWDGPVTLVEAEDIHPYERPPLSKSVLMGEKTVDQCPLFEEGLLDLRRRQGLYSESPRGVEINGGVLYRAVITIPSQVPVGTYTAETFLIDRHKVIAAATRDIQIDKSGFERTVALAARRHRLVYGLACVLLSLGLGWAAAAAFRRRF